ncbi:MAG: glucokinase, partial [Pseudomonadota bacterium]
MAATARVGGSGPSLIADIGGTNVRFALVEGAGDPSHIRKSKVAEFPSFSEALGDYLSAVPDRPSAAMIAVAGPVSGGAATLTNADWTITAADVNAHLPGVPVRLMNDFEAVALALPHLAPSEWQTLGPHPSDAPSLNAPLPKLALGAGTGLGTCLLVPIPGGGWLTVPAEGGHRTLDPSLLATLPAPGEGPPPTA